MHRTLKGRCRILFKSRVCLAETILKAVSRSGRRDRRFSHQLGQNRVWLVADSTNEEPIPITALFNAVLISDVTAIINREYVFEPAERHFIVRFQFQKFYASLCWRFEIPVSCAGRQSNFLREFSSLPAISSVFCLVNTQCLDSVIILNINDPAGIFLLLSLHNHFWHRLHEQSSFQCVLRGCHFGAGRLDTAS
jgi:hypothetical protein